MTCACVPTKWHFLPSELSRGAPSGVPQFLSESPHLCFKLQWLEPHFQGCHPTNGMTQDTRLRGSSLTCHHFQQVRWGFVPITDSGNQVLRTSLAFTDNRRPPREFLCPVRLSAVSVTPARTPSRPSGVFVEGVSERLPWNVTISGVYSGEIYQELLGV